MIVAEITRDYLTEQYNEPDSIKGKEFDYEATLAWCGCNKLPFEDNPKLPQTSFRLYDDDGELYYEGWLYNDENAIVQQFVLAWAKYHSGCTTIKIFRRNEYVQEIG